MNDEFDAVHITIAKEVFRKYGIDCTDAQADAFLRDFFAAQQQINLGEPFPKNITLVEVPPTVPVIVADR